MIPRTWPKAAIWNALSLARSTGIPKGTDLMSEEPRSAGKMRGGASVSRWRAAFPPAQWLPAYRPEWLARDAIAGANARRLCDFRCRSRTLRSRDCRRKYGIYCYLAGGLAYALFGSSRHLAIGPTSAISMLVGVTVAGMAEATRRAGYRLQRSRALLVAAMCRARVASAVEFARQFHQRDDPARLQGGRRVDDRADPVAQAVRRRGRRRPILRARCRAGRPASRYQPRGAGIRSHRDRRCLLLGEKFLPGRPVALLVVAVSIIVLSATPLGALGFKVVGALPQGLPEFRLPGLRVRDVDGVIPLAFACLLLSYVESVSAARALAQAHGYEVDPRQELLGLGAANLAAGLFQGYPVAGGLSQSSVNDKAGAKTPLALVFASVTIGLCLMYLAGLLSNLPNVILAAIVLVAVKGLVNVAELRHLWRGEPPRVQRVDGGFRAPC